MIESFGFSRKHVDKSSKDGAGVKLEKKKSKEGDFWRTFRLSFAKHITRPLFSRNAKLEYARPLSILGGQKSEIEINEQASKKLSPGQGGPTREEIYASALELAKDLGWREKAPEKQEEDTVVEQETQGSDEGIPVFITKRLRRDLNKLGVPDEEIDKLKPSEAWELLQAKTSEQEIKESWVKNIYSTEQIKEDFSLIQKMWDEAYARMGGVNEDERTSRVLSMTARTFDDPKPLEDYLQKEAHGLNPEEKFFIEMSIEVKKFRARAKELLAGEETHFDDISNEDFERFVDTNEVSEAILERIAEKIRSHKQISEKEISIYATKAKEIEMIIKGGE